MHRYLLLLTTIALFGCAPESTDAQDEKDAMIQDAVRAAMPSITNEATIMDWENNTLREGTNGWVCFPTPPGFEPGTSPMCFDEVWQSFGPAWMGKQEFQAEGVGISYMLMGDSGSSNTDPYATEATPDNDWVVSGPHLMILLPDNSALEGISTDPRNGGPFVMWKGTPYAHIMVPVGAH